MITYNGLYQYGNLITFTDIPNILKVSDTSGGTYATLYIVLSPSLASETTYDGQWHITFMGETVTNTVSPNNAINKNFYISESAVSTAVSLARAFRNCSTVAAYFNIENTTYNGNDCVMLKAKAIGPVWAETPNYFETNILPAYITTTGVDGTTDSSLYGAKIDVDVYQNDNYVTTLEKSFYNGEAAFNLSPVLTTFAKYGWAMPYTLKVSSIVNGEYSLLYNIPTNYISVGYMVNQGAKYLNNAVDVNIANNLSRGESREFVNNTILYIYQPKMAFSFYAPNNVNMMSIHIGYLNSAYEQIYFESSYWLKMGNNTLYDFTVNLNEEKLREAFYIDIYSREFGTLRFNVIKPIKATEYCQRVYWRNSYGGISFFDFTGQKTEIRDVEVSTYEKNIFDYYTDDMNELEKVYDNTVKYTVTLKSHLIENDGKYVFNDLLQSSKVWTTINNQNYAIIVDSISVDEVDNNNIYEATLKYHYSQEPSLI